MRGARADPGLAPGDRAQLERWRWEAEGRRAKRAEVILLVAEGASDRAIAHRLGVAPRTAAKWRRRFEIGGIEAIRREAPRSRRPRGDAELAARIAALGRRPAPRAGGWSVRALARELGVSHMRVHRVARRAGLPLGRPRGSSGANPGTPSATGVAPLGVYFDRGARMIAFATSSLRRPPAGGSLHRRSGATGRAAPAIRSSLLEQLLPRLTSLWGAVPRPPGPAGSTSDLLVFLRTLEQRAPRRGSVHLLLEAAGPLPPGVRDWLGARPRFRVHAPAPGEGWLARCLRWAEEWNPSHRATAGGATPSEQWWPMDLSAERTGSRPTSRFTWTPAVPSPDLSGPGGVAARRERAASSSAWSVLGGP